MIYKSRRAYGKPLQLGVAVADTPDGKFERLSENPILEFSDENKHIEDPFLWYDEAKKKFLRRLPSEKVDFASSGGRKQAARKEEIPRL